MFLCGILGLIICTLDDRRDLSVEVPQYTLEPGRHPPPPLPDLLVILRLLDVDVSKIIRELLGLLESLSTNVGRHVLVEPTHLDGSLLHAEALDVHPDHKISQ